MLFKFALSTILERKSYLLALFTVLLIPLVFPYLTPWEENPSIIQPARAQAAWVSLWFVTIGWLFYQTTDMGHRYSANGVFQYARFLGASKFSCMVQCWLCGLVFMVALLLVTMGISILLCSPGNREEARMWLMMNLQYGALFLLVCSPLLLLSIALGSRVAAAAAFCFVVGLSFYGLLVLPYGEFYLKETQSDILRLGWHLSPHYHVADLTSRLVFKMGPLEPYSMMLMSLYFAVVGVTVSSISYILFKERK